MGCGSTLDMLVRLGVGNDALPSEHVWASAVPGSRRGTGPCIDRARSPSVLILRRALGRQRDGRVCGPDSDTVRTYLPRSHMQSHFHAHLRAALALPLHHRLVRFGPVAPHPRPEVLPAVVSGGSRSSVLTRVTLRSLDSSGTDHNAATPTATRRARCTGRARGSRCSVRRGCGRGRRSACRRAGRGCTRCPSTCARRPCP